MNLPKLTPRLQAAADMISSADSVIDIGTDHGYLPIYLLLCGKTKCAVAADIRKGPLENAAENIRAFGVDAVCVLSDGFEKINTKYSCAFICGMGGETIAEIIDKGKSVTPDTLVLQPMTGADKLRKYLFENGYFITEESFVSEGEKVYCLIKAEKTGENTPYSYADLFLGKIRPNTGGYEKWKQKVRLQAEKRLLGGIKAEDKKLIEICKNEK